MMDDYKKLIEELRNFTYWLGQSGPESHDIHPPVCEKAAVAIENLLQQRDTAIGEIEHDCYHCFYQGRKRNTGVCWDCLPDPMGIHKTYKNWKWHGFTN